MPTNTSPRYYIRDSETNELWCFDAKALADGYSYLQEVGLTLKND